MAQFLAALVFESLGENFKGATASMSCLLKGSASQVTSVNALRGNRLALGERSRVFP